MVIDSATADSEHDGWQLGVYDLKDFLEIEAQTATNALPGMLPGQ